MRPYGERGAKKESTARLLFAQQPRPAGRREKTEGGNGCQEDGIGWRVEGMRKGSVVEGGGGEGRGRGHSAAPVFCFFSPSVCSPKPSFQRCPYRNLDKNTHTDQSSAASQEESDQGSPPHTQRERISRAKTFCKSQQQNRRSRKKRRRRMSRRRRRTGGEYRLAFRAPRGPLSSIRDERAAKHQPCSFIPHPRPLHHHLPPTTPPQAIPPRHLLCLSRVLCL